jgi:hypothetical protein
MVTKYLALYGVLNAESEFQEATKKSVPPFGNLSSGQRRAEIISSSTSDG